MNLIVMIVIRFLPKVWEKLIDEEISAKINITSYVIHAYSVSDDQASHILMLGFRNTTQKERYLCEKRTKFAEEISTKSIFAFSVDKIIL